jgi:flagellar protein FlaG
MSADGASSATAVKLTVVQPVADSSGAGLRRERSTPQPAPHRLVIEEGARPGTFVYKTIDRTTGEVIRQLPREDVIRLRDQPSVPTGRVADITA